MVFFGLFYFFWGALRSQGLFTSAHHTTGGHGVVPGGIGDRLQTAYTHRFPAAKPFVCGSCTLADTPLYDVCPELKGNKEKEGSEVCHCCQSSSLFFSVLHREEVGKGMCSNLSGCRVNLHVLSILNDARISRTDTTEHISKGGWVGLPSV